MALNKVDILTGADIREITGEGIIVKSGGPEKTIKADTVVIATGLKPDDELYKTLKGQFSNVYIVGDSREPRNIMGAIWDGFEVGRTL
jgi:2-enoate reductase